MPMTAAELLQRARDHRQQYRYADALQACEAALALDPTLAEGYLLRGELRYFSSGNPYSVRLPNPTEAEHAAIMADFEEAVRLAPTNFPLLIECAHWLGTARAIEIYTAILAIDPTHWQAYYRRGMAHQIVQRYAEALADFDQAIQLDPANPAGYAVRGSCHEAQRQRAQAAADFQRALELGHTGYRTAYMRDYVQRYGKK